MISFSFFNAEFKMPARVTGIYIRGLVMGALTAYLSGSKVGSIAAITDSLDLPFCHVPFFMRPHVGAYFFRLIGLR